MISPAVRTLWSLIAVTTRHMEQLHNAVVAVELPAAVELHQMARIRLAKADTTASYYCKP